MANRRITILLILAIILASCACADNATDEAAARITGVICKFICLAEMTVGAIAALMIIFAGLRYVTAGEDAGVRRRVRGWIINAFVGIVIVAVAVSIVNYVASEISAPLNCKCGAEEYLKGSLNTGDTPTAEKQQNKEAGQSKKPDLIASGIDASDSVKKILQGLIAPAPPNVIGKATDLPTITRYMFTMQVENAGEKEACQIEAAAYVDGIEACRKTYMDCLPANGSAPIECTTDSFGYNKNIKQHIIKAVIDPGNKIEETNETNNVIEKTIGEEKLVIQSPDKCPEGQFYTTYKQMNQDNCDNIKDPGCVGKNTDPKDYACCKNNAFCVSGGKCTEGFYLADLDGDGVAGELCMSPNWVDCDYMADFCSDSSICNMHWVAGGENGAFGEYDTGTSIECCGDDADEVYVDYGPGAPKCCKKLQQIPGEPKKYNYVDESGKCTSTEKAPPKLTLLFIPVNWGETDSISDPWIFGNGVYKEFKDLVEDIPLSNCSERAVAVTSYVNCKFKPDCSKIGGILGTGDFNQVLACARKTGEKFDYVVGVSQSGYCGLGGQSGGERVVILSGFGSLEHELGHQWGLNGEYMDTCRCQGVDYVSGSNCLDKTTGGSDPASGYTSDYCAGGTKCVDYGEFETTCLGNLNPIGGRCIMAHGNAYCKQCYDHLLANPKLICEDQP